DQPPFFLSVLMPIVFISAIKNPNTLIINGRILVYCKI
ncbi:hypothetical protein SS7213T_03560, partial [Staphylococcus simiae CCM 7213 = CCUG 51256]